MKYRFTYDYLAQLVISAKYGLLEWDTEIEWYDQEMDMDRAYELKPKIQKDLQSFLDDKEYEKLYIKMGKVYRTIFEGFDWEQHFREKIVATGIRTEQRRQLIGWLKEMTLLPYQQFSRCCIISSYQCIEIDTAGDRFTECVRSVPVSCLVSVLIQSCGHCSDQ